MTYEDRIESLERELVAERLFSIRTRLFLGVYFIASVVPQFKSIFNSMNVELPEMTKLLLASSDIMQDWGVFLLPAGWIVWRLIEDRLLAHRAPRRLRLVRAALTVALVLTVCALYLPMVKICNNVG